MSEVSVEERQVHDVPNEPQADKTNAYMNRLFCSTKERIGYVTKTAFSGITLGKYEVDSDLFRVSLFKMQPVAFAKQNVWLSLFDMINDPMSAAIIDNMRTRWGKFKPFQYLSLIPSIIIGLSRCFLPLIANFFGAGVDNTSATAMAKRLMIYMIICYVSETVNAFVGGSGYIDNVFTPNPAERSSLLVAAKFVADLIIKFPEQLTGVVIDVIDNKNKGLPIGAKIDVTKPYIALKTFWWAFATIPSIYWIFVSKERVVQSEKPPNPWHSIKSIFQNKPLLVYTISDVIGGISVGTSESLYYREVLNFTMLPTFGGIAGSPISYASYPLATKFRQRFSTKSLWVLESLSVSFSETLFFLVGLIGGKTNGMYKRKIPMLLAFSVGNCVEMLFYGTRRVIGDEINFEVLDFCEWKNGYRVEATINLIRGYLQKVRTMILNVINANLLQYWAGYDMEATVQSDTTKWRMFLTACGPKLIFGYLSVLPKLFYNIDKKTRDQMYLDLEKSRAAAAARELLAAEIAQDEQNQSQAL